MTKINQEIVKLVNSYFDKNDSYGDNLFLGSNAVQHCKNEEMLSLIENEEVLILFTYFREPSVGFALTDKKLVLADRYGIQEFPLNSLLFAMPDKRVLAEVLFVKDMSGKFSRDMYLTGIRNSIKFQVQFIRLIKAIHTYFYPEAVEKVNFPKYNWGKRLFEEFKFDSSGVEFGNPLNEKSSKRYYHAILNFWIPEYEKIYFIYDSSVNVSCKQGIAVCSTGIYGCDDNKDMFYFAWETFGKVSYKKSFFGITIGKHTFTCADKKKILSILDYLSALCTQKIMYEGIESVETDLPPKSDLKRKYEELVSIKDHNLRNEKVIEIYSYICRKNKKPIPEKFKYSEYDECLEGIIEIEERIIKIYPQESKIGVKELSQSISDLMSKGAKRATLFSITGFAKETAPIILEGNKYIDITIEDIKNEL